MKEDAFEVLLFYKYVNIDNPEKLKAHQKNLCEKLGLKGRIIIAKEGINATVEGLKSKTTKYIEELTKDKRFNNIHFKKNAGDGKSFPKLSIKVRPEIVSAHLQNGLNPKEVTGKYITPEELHNWIHSDKEFYIVDMRNDYEQLSGYFKGSILSEFTNFRDLPKIIPKLNHLKDKTIVTVCTGGIRCEKASGFLLENGFKDVYQLYGGIVSYMEKYPNEDFLGVLYVFDNRLVVGFNLNDPKHQIVGRCFKCSKPSESYKNCAYDICHYHTIVCDSCFSKDGNFYCKKECEEKYYQKFSTI